MTAEITETIARKVLETVDAGLVSGLGKPVPGQMCVEAAVCYAMGLPHSDEPNCVSPAIRSLKIALNDKSWASNEVRAKGMRRLALAQLGSAGVVDDKLFARHCAELAIRKYVPKALRSAAVAQRSPDHHDALEAAAELCETTPTRESAVKARACAADAAYAAADAADAAATYVSADAAAAAAADAAAYAADAAAEDAVLGEFAEDVVQILVNMHAPGCQWLWMTETN